MIRGKILIADDEKQLVSSLVNVFTKEGYTVQSCTNSAKFFDTVNHFKPDAVLLDIYFGDENGIEMYKRLKDIGHEMPVIMITGYSDVTTAVEAMKVGAEDFVVKPFDLTYLHIVVERAVEHSMLQRKIAVLQEELKQQSTAIGIVAKSEQMKEILHTADRIAQSPTTTVLIEGESGTGKELLAKYIYLSSLTPDKPFVTVNCAAIPKDLAESEFFGYERGAFTGATEKMKKGKFELADGGIIFLDEIGELSLDMQVKLLRLLEEKRFYRLGGTQEITVDVRVIAATNRKLEEEVKKRNFREDLYYRLNVAAIQIPPLRERKEDIEGLFYTFIHDFCRKFGKSISSVSPDIVKFLELQMWKGNVRELRNAVERAILLSDDEEIREEHFKFLNNQSTEGKLNAVGAGSDYLLKIPGNGIKMENVVRDLILQTLSLTKGNQVQAANILGLTRSKLRYRMDQLGIKPEQKEYSVQRY